MQGNARLSKPALMTHTKQKVFMGAFQQQLSAQEWRREAKVQAGIMQKGVDDNGKCHYANKTPMEEPQFAYLASYLKQVLEDLEKVWKMWQEWLTNWERFCSMEDKIKHYSIWEREDGVADV